MGKYTISQRDVNCSGTIQISQVVIVFIHTSEIIMAQIQLTQTINTRTNHNQAYQLVLSKGIYVTRKFLLPALTLQGVFHR